MWVRPWEALTHTAVLLALITQFFVTEERQQIGWMLFVFHVAWIIFTLIGCKREGIRIAHTINSVVFLPWSIYYFWAAYNKNFSATTNCNLVLSTLTAVFWLHNVYYTKRLGASDFSRLKFDGPYKVGVRHINMGEFDSEVAVFYPIDESEYALKIKDRNAPWLKAPNKWIDSQQRILSQFLPFYVPKFFLRQFVQVKIDCVLGGDLSFDFTSGKKDLHPLIFSHGIFGDNHSYTGLLKDMASHGYIVFALNHSDGTCIYTENSLG